MSGMDWAMVIAVVVLAHAQGAWWGYQQGFKEGRIEGGQWAARRFGGLVGPSSPLPRPTHTSIAAGDSARKGWA